ncbi:hypothetical protein [Paenibacillus sp. GCM10023250]|uniref:hypothetical protein n=1 Tax=Paenibacillus sp. GCM10023250 TaxID=3252648 RepID=UPI00361D6A58
MNRLALLLVSAAFLVAMTGCGSLIDPVPKNVYRVKTFKEGHPNHETAISGGVLSIETAKSLGLNAVEKYLGNRLSPDDARFEVTAVDVQALKELVEQQMRPDEKKQAETKLNEVPEGLFYLTIISPNNERYGLVLNAGTGDVLKISDDTQAGTESAGIPGDKAISAYSELANQFLVEKGLSSSGLWADGGLFVEAREAAYYCIRSTEDDSLDYLIEVDIAENQVTGFSKDIMAMLTWNAKVFAKAPSMQE